MKIRTPYRFILAGGGTGGHLYPALAVAQMIRELISESEILFIGTKNKIEAKVVPEYGFEFKSIWISGFSRKLTLNNLLFPIKVVVAAIQSLIIQLRFKPRVVLGCGAYVSGPVVWAASVLGSKIILLEQNSYPGVTNRLLEKKADEIHITFEESKKYFRAKNKLLLTGNPVRITLKLIDREIALKNIGLDTNKKVLLVMGGSLGAKSINDAVANSIDKLLSIGVQIIWQTGQNYFDQYKQYGNESVKVMPFINDMSAAYSACDILVARSGATTITEAAYLGLAVIFVPSINVAANHQYINAKSLFDNDAAELIEDKNIKSDLFDKVNYLINNEDRLKVLKENISKFAKPEAARNIAENAIKYAAMIN